MLVIGQLGLHDVLQYVKYVNAAGVGTYSNYNVTVFNQQLLEMSCATAMRIKKEVYSRRVISGVRWPRAPPSSDWRPATSPSLKPLQPSLKFLVSRTSSLRSVATKSKVTLEETEYSLRERNLKVAVQYGLLTEKVI
jgi:hypothetical protein